MTALKLLEMQRHALLMYTSCGWFFADLSGLETLQVIKYAARALQLGQEFTAEPLEEPFLKILERAVSNIPRGGQRPHHLPEADQALGGGLPQGGQPVGDFVAQGPGAPVSPPHLPLPGGARGPGGQDPGLAAVRRRASPPDFGHHPGEPIPGVFHRVSGKLSLPHPGAGQSLPPRSFSPCGRSFSGSWRRPRKT